ncbi:Uncharacterized protein GBIM_10052 [Gryllus bimaculatus]|nr:Uncharacterized protein GBIM_10052 [Gryllus bimaculatus]
MGNEGSHLAGLEVEDEAIEVTEAWSMYSACLSTGSMAKLSVFVSPMFPGIAKSNVPSLIQASKNLMLHRHPCILKFVSTWSHGGRFHLATEEVRPLSHVLDQQTSLQICLGLHSILKAVVFLHDKAKASHNNVCRAAIYVSPDGTWKLGGFEFLCLFQDMSATRLQQTHAHRYEKAIAPEEDGSTLTHPSAVDQYAFGVLVEEVLKKSEEELNCLAEFRELARRQLQSSEPSLRPPLAPLLEHPFFDHKFLHIHSFLLELPLKSEGERQDFFSRMVLLDHTAQEHLLPALLQPRKEGDEACGKGIFSMAVFKHHVVPRLLQMLCVRDAQIRLLLLSHFQCFLSTFSVDQLRSSVLPELLVGIKDTNDTLVSMTLKALADMVPVLGAAVVIGGKRGKLFTDGRPKVHQTPIKDLKKQEKVLPEPSSLPTIEVNGNGLPDYGSHLPERPSPDGGEAEATNSDKGEEEVWSDWDVDTVDNVLGSAISGINVGVPAEPVGHGDAEIPVIGLPDIMSLDIKNLTSPVGGEEFDFFQDMEPVISKPQIVQVEVFAPGEKNSQALKSNGSLFDVALASTEGDAWGDDLGDWALEETSEALSGKLGS